MAKPLFPDRTELAWHVGRLMWSGGVVWQGSTHWELELQQGLRMKSQAGLNGMQYPYKHT